MNNKKPGAHVSGLEWLLVGMGPIAVLISLYLLFLKGVVHNRRSLLDRVDQLGHRLHERLLEQRSEQNQELSSITQEIIEILQDSEEQQQSSVSSILSSGLSSIHPVKESIAVLSKRLSALDSEHVSQNDPLSLNLASLAVSYIRSHLNEVVRVEQIADELNVTSGKLYTCLKECLSCSVQELIIIVKMQEAKKLLATEDLLVKQVAIQLGFWSPYHFSSRFRSIFGLSPKQYKEEVQKRKRHKVSETDSADRLEARRKLHKQEETQHQPEKYTSQKSVGTESLPSGTAIDRFLIVNRIGHGGMGVVYKAYDPKLNRGVALKLIRADKASSSQSQNRLLREAQALARLSHPNVLHVYDVGTFGDQIFMTMALVEGQTLREWLNKQKRSIKEILKIMMAAGRGLSAAHKAGLVHRDFKPSNVIVGNDGQVRVLDFGLARIVEAQEYSEDNDKQPHDADVVINFEEFSSGDSSNMLLTSLTHAGKILGTPLYMAPEQHLGINTDERTDQFGFCVVMYEALYGKRPFVARSREDLINEVIHQQVCIPPADSDIPGWLWQIVQKGLSAKPEDRYATMDSLLDDLDKDPEQERLQKRIAKRRTLVVVGLILLVAVLPVCVWYGLRYRTFQLCKATEREFDGVWDAKTKDSIQKAFLGTKKSFAKWTWERVKNVFDGQKANYIRMRSEICEAKILCSTLSEELFDLRMSCLKQRTIELKALAKVFVNADTVVLEKAAQAGGSLSSVAICADDKALRASYPPPKNAETKRKVTNIREKLAEVQALEKTGKYQDGLNLVKRLYKEACLVAYRPVQAESLYWVGRLLEKNGKYKRAETALHEAARLAGKNREALISAKAMAWLVWVIGFRQARPEEGLLIGRYAEIMLDVSGGSQTVQAVLLNNIGVLFDSQGEHERALEYFRNSLAIREESIGSAHPDVVPSLNNIARAYYNMGEYDKALEYLNNALVIRENVLGPDHTLVAGTLNNMGSVFHERGEYDKALRYHRRALAIRENTLGGNHPLVAMSLDNMGLAFLRQGEYNKALEYHRRALEIREKTLGSEHPEVVWSLSSIGNILVDQRKPKQAIGPLERVVSLCEKKTCNPDPSGRGLFGLARAVVLTGGDKQRAIKLAKQAREIFGKTPKAFKKEIEEVTIWLKDNGVKSAAKKAH